MSSHSPIALAYCADDQSTALEIEQSLGKTSTFQHYTVDDANEGPILSESLANFQGRLILLISDNFLRNPNCMLHANRLINTTVGAPRETKAIIIDSQRYDEQLGELVQVHANLEKQKDIMGYINHWQERYLDLRRQRKELSQEIGPNFDSYLTKIREVSGQVNDFLHYLKDSMPLRWNEFAANNFHQFYIFTEQEEAWRPAPKTEPAPAVVEPLAPPPIIEVAAPEIPAKETEPLPEPEPVSAPIEPVPTAAKTAEAGANTFIRRAWALADKGDAKAALDLLASGLEALPENMDIQYHRALLLATEFQDTQTARTEINQLLQQNPDHLDALFLSGELYAAAGEQQAARDNWEHLSDIRPTYPEVNRELGLLIADHFPDDALDAAAYLRLASKSEDADTEVYYRYALLLASPALDRSRKAIKMLRKVLDLNPDHAPAHYELAVRYHAEGEYRAALQSYRYAAGLDPQFATNENEKAFAIPAKATPQLMTEHEAGALSALKDNIAQLESLLHQREAEALAAQEEAQAIALNNRPGTGKTVMISGATAGIGLATAKRFAAEGYRLLITGRRKPRLTKLKQELQKEHSIEVRTLNFDVRDRAAVARAISALPKTWSNIDILINNAGKAKGFDPIHEGDLDHWDEMIDTNLRGLLYLTRAVSPKMVARGEGLIINVCSTAGKEVYPNGNVYCATKHAVDALTAAMRLDLVKHGVRVGQICPAHVEETEFALVRFDGDASRAEKVYENFQPLRSSDVAESIYFMVSQPPHVNILDLVIQGKQQASSTMIDRSGREEEE